MSTPTNGRRWTAVDRGMLHLVRLVLDDAWHPTDAGAHLRRLIADQRVLQQMDARVRNALAERPSPLGERAARTLAVAMRSDELEVVPPHPGTSGPRPPLSRRAG